MKKIITIHLTLGVAFSVSLTVFADGGYFSIDNLPDYHHIHFDVPYNNIYYRDSELRKSTIIIRSDYILDLYNQGNLIASVPLKDTDCSFYIEDENASMSTISGMGYVANFYEYGYILDFDGSFYYLQNDDVSNEDTPTEPETETIYIKENRPLFETPLTDYSVTEGLLLLLFVVTVLNSIFKSHIKR